MERWFDFSLKEAKKMNIMSMIRDSEVKKQ